MSFPNPEDYADEAGKWAGVIAPLLWVMRRFWPLGRSHEILDSVKGIDQRLDKIENAVGETRESVARLEGQFEEHTRQDEKMRQDIAGLDRDVRQIRWTR